MNTESPAIDALDRRIIDLLQHDGRQSYQALSEAIGLSRPATRARLLRLLDTRILEIKGVVHPTVFGLHSYAHASIKVVGSAEVVAESLVSAVDIPFVSITAGNHALVAELRCRDQSTLTDILGWIKAMPQVQSVQASVYASIVKDAYWPPRPFLGSELAPADIHLLELLQHDGRSSYVELAERTQLSPTAVRTRMARLLSTGVLHIGARIRPDVMGSSHIFGFGLTVQGNTTPVIDLLRPLDAVQYLAATLGRHDVVGTATAPSIAEMLTILEQIRAIDGVYDLEVWTHLRFVKEDYDRWPIKGQYTTESN
ncbi:Lrp/AsnC family transcriptional regulator [Rhodococcus sp. IEGM1428]|uniref:Lrp/AsnC family transcriptional regulator n=1 Tax=Rhodococcus sp. IEGM1428 TaxID=3392191 RepID=UPI003D0AD0DA